MATIEIVRLMKQTRMEGDNQFLQDLDPERVANELFDYSMVKNAANKLGGLKVFEGINAEDPYVREEVIKL